MSKIHSECPLCKNESEHYLSDHENVKIFTCPSCNLFKISETAERKISTFTEKELIALSLMSKSCANNEILDIKFCATNQKLVTEIIEK